MTQSGYTVACELCTGLPSVDATGADGALKRADTVVCEPMHHFHLEIPATYVRADHAGAGTVACCSTTPDHARSRHGYWKARFRRQIGCTNYINMLPALTHGEGVLESEFDHYSTDQRTVSNSATIG